MILPTKSLQPVNSLYCISAFVVEIMIAHDGIDFDALLNELNHVYPVPIPMEKLQLCLDFLFIIGRLELQNETLKALLK